NIWNDRWLPGPGNGRIECQNIDIRYSKEQLQHIVSIPLVSSRLQDVPVWRGDNTGLWELKILSKIRILIWRIANDYLPTLHNLKVRNLVVNTLCSVCQTEEESVDHLFRVCIFTQQVLRVWEWWSQHATERPVGRIG
ncbi:hypothetical protein Goarm_022952, partial [Gossypium armourianum]|nr:hypothetical protein [Gossypium armourianum]